MISFFKKIGLKGLVSKETEVLRWLGSETQNFGLINWVVKVNWPPIHSDERLMLETSAFNFFTVANLPCQLSFVLALLVE